VDVSRLAATVLELFASFAVAIATGSENCH
jgi:hypothetical protein